MAKRRPTKPRDAISYQVSVRGPGLRTLTHKAMSELVDRYVSGQQDPPDGVSIRIQCWRAGTELDMWADNSRAITLRETFRRLLQAGRISLAVREDSEDHDEL